MIIANSYVCLQYRRALTIPSIKHSSFLAFVTWDSLVFLNVLNFFFSLMPSSTSTSFSYSLSLNVNTLKRSICLCPSQFSGNFLTINPRNICFRITKGVLCTCRFSCSDPDLPDQKTWSCNPDSQFLTSTHSDYYVPQRLKITAVYIHPFGNLI